MDRKIPEQDIWGPYSLSLSKAEVEEIAKIILTEVLPNPPAKSSFLKKLRNLNLGSILLALVETSKQEFYMERHLDSPDLWSICQDVNLLAKLKEHLGEDIVLWRSELWVNKVSKQLIPMWHQDGYPKLRKNKAETRHVYIALTEVNAENGFEYIPTGKINEECQLKMRDPFSGNPFFDLPLELTKEAETVELQPGEFVIFSDRLIHRSKRNQTNQLRLSLTLRVSESQLKLGSLYSSNHHQPIKL